MIKCELKHFSYLDSNIKNLERKTKETIEDLRKLKISLNEKYIK